MKSSDVTGTLGDRRDADVISGNDNLKHSLEGWRLMVGEISLEQSRKNRLLLLLKAHVNPI